MDVWNLGSFTSPSGSFSDIDIRNTIQEAVQQLKNTFINDLKSMGCLDGKNVGDIIYIKGYLTTTTGFSLYFSGAGSPNYYHTLYETYIDCQFYQWFYGGSSGGDLLHLHTYESHFDDYLHNYTLDSFTITADMLPSVPGLEVESPTLPNTPLTIPQQLAQNFLTTVSSWWKNKKSREHLKNTIDILLGDKNKQFIKDYTIAWEDSEGNKHNIFDYFKNNNGKLLLGAFWDSTTQSLTNKLGTDIPYYVLDSEKSLYADGITDLVDNDGRGYEVQLPYLESEVNQMITDQVITSTDGYYSLTDENGNKFYYLPYQDGYSSSTPYDPSLTSKSSSLEVNFGNYGLDTVVPNSIEPTQEDIEKLPQVTTLKTPGQTWNEWYEQELLVNKQNEFEQKAVEQTANENLASGEVSGEVQLVIGESAGIALNTDGKSVSLDTEGKTVGVDASGQSLGVDLNGQTMGIDATGVSVGIDTTGKTLGLDTADKTLPVDTTNKTVAITGLQDINLLFPQQLAVDANGKYYFPLDLGDEEFKQKWVEWFGQKLVEHNADYQGTPENPSTTTLKKSFLKEIIEYFTKTFIQGETELKKADRDIQVFRKEYSENDGFSYTDNFGTTRTLPEGRRADNYSRALEHERLTEIAYRNLRVKNHREKAEEVGLKGFINDIIQGIEEVKLKYNLPEGLALFEDLQAFVDAYKLRDDGSGGE